jgi:hypothetical protein
VANMLVSESQAVPVPVLGPVLVPIPVPIHVTVPVVVTVAVPVLVPTPLSVPTQQVAQARTQVVLDPVPVRVAEQYQ